MSDSVGASFGSPRVRVWVHDSLREETQAMCPTRPYGNQRVRNCNLRRPQDFARRPCSAQRIGSRRSASEGPRGEIEVLAKQHELGRQDPPLPAEADEIDSIA